MEPICLRFGGYQPPTSVHTRAGEVFLKELASRVGDAVQVDFTGNIIAAGHNAADLLPMVENGVLTMGETSPDYEVNVIRLFATLNF